MPIATGGGASNITGASIVDGTVSLADLVQGARVTYMLNEINTCTPQPNFHCDNITNGAFTSNTSMGVGQICVPNPITINKISLNAQVVTTPGTFKIALFSEDGQTKHFEVTTSSISATGTSTHTLGAAVRVPAGIYYLAVVSVGTASAEFQTYTVLTQTMVDGVSGKPVLSGRITVTAGTIPATMTPTAPTYNNVSCVHVRFDN